MAILRFALLALVVAAAAACYKPNIMNGGLGCSDAGTCPEGFVCSPIDNHCYKPDAGPSCPANMAHVTPLCSDPPASGSVCNPACQTGCACGRCTVVGTVTACTVVGPKTEGSLCNPAADDCASGLGCVRELCGTNVARCRKFCRLKPDCSGNEFCSDIFGPAYVCQAPADLQLYGDGARGGRLHQHRSVRAGLHLPHDHGGDQLLQGLRLEQPPVHGHEPGMPPAVRSEPAVRLLRSAVRPPAGRRQVG